MPKRCATTVKGHECGGHVISVVRNYASNARYQDITHDMVIMVEAQRNRIDLDLRFVY